MIYYNDDYDLTFQELDELEQMGVAGLRNRERLDGSSVLEAHFPELGWDE